MAGRINRVNIRKTAYFLKRNGIKNTCYAIRERLAGSRQPLYRFTPPREEELARQRMVCRSSEPVHTISIVVPCYRTSPKYLLEMMDSVRGQTYPRWELILADATEDDNVGRVARTVTDSRIRYVHLSENAGIAENTNRGIEAATGDYVGLLDHDDLLTQDALFQMAAAISQREKMGREALFLYSDEDKCNGEGTVYYEPNRKEDFNLDLLLSNNYICHFLVLERKLIQELLLRSEYEGAQDYDLVLRAAERLTGREESIVHVSKILYHWRCHKSSTAENPQSKLYAYEAGRRAVQSFADRRGWQARAVDTVHLGFYRLQYAGDLFASRPDLGALGGPLVRKARICSGRLKENGDVYFEGLHHRFSGYLNRASLHQDAESLDIRNIRIREEAWELFHEVVGVPWKPLPGQEIFDVATLPEGVDYKAVSLALGRALHKAGYRLLYLPEYERKLKS